MKKRIFNGCFFGAVVIILMSQMQLSVISQTLELDNELEYDIDISKINDNGTDIKELPYFLNGTILDGNIRVIVTKNGLPPKGLTPDDYDKVISLKEKKSIIDNARERFKDTYGIDPYYCPNRKNTNLRFKEFINDYYKNGLNSEISDKYCMIKNNNGGPHQIGGCLGLIVVYACDSRYRPRNPSRLYDKSIAAFDRIGDEFDLTLLICCEYFGWDASDVTSGRAEDLLADLEEDCAYLRFDDNYILLGWVDNTCDHTGIAYRYDFYSLAREQFTWFIDHEDLALHEMSHCFGAPDHGYFWPLCLMSYIWLWFGWDWCSSCKNTLYNQIWK